MTSLGGYGGTVKLGKMSKKRLQFETSVTLRSPGLEFNDIGFMRYSDVIHHGIWVAYYIRNPFAIFNNFYLNTNYWMYWNFSGKLLSTNTNINFNSQFRNRWRMNGSFSRRSENISTTMLRGGPSFISPGDQGFNLNLRTDPSKRLSLSAGGYFGSRDIASAIDKEFWSGISVRPMNSMSISVEPNFNVQNDKLQYVTTITNIDDPVYLFGELHQKTLSLTFRINYTINPVLSIEYYGQPFISAGSYSEFKKITSPMAERLCDRYYIFTPDEISYNSVDNVYLVDDTSDPAANYSFNNPDFNFHQFRSNMIIRWEYSPGSTLYLVWSQGRTSSGNDGHFSYGSDMKDLFQIVPHNVFLLKFSYWFKI